MAPFAGGRARRTGDARADRDAADGLRSESDVRALAIQPRGRRGGGNLGRRGPGAGARGRRARANHGYSQRRRLRALPSARGAERAAARAALGIGADEIALGTVGRSKRAKAIASCSRRWRRWYRCVAFRCFIAGSGSEREALAAEIRELGLTGTVSLTGGVEDPRQLLSALDVFVFPSLKEGLGVALMEAMACGIAVVASRPGGIRRAGRTPMSGLLVRSRSAAELARALTDLMAAPERSARNGSRRTGADSRGFQHDGDGGADDRALSACLDSARAARKGEAMRSMTGFGRAELERGGVRVAVDVRALNQRFLELKMSLPRGWGEHEGEMRKLVQDFVERGRVEVTFVAAASGRRRARLIVNEALAGQYVEGMRRLGKRLGLGREIAPEAISSAPRFSMWSKRSRIPTRKSSLAAKRYSHALKALDAERTREGAALKKDLATRLGEIQRAINKIAQARGGLPAGDSRRFSDSGARTGRHPAAGRETPLRRRRGHRPARRYQRGTGTADQPSGGLQRAAGASRAGWASRSTSCFRKSTAKPTPSASKSQNAELSRVVVEVKAS